MNKIFILIVLMMGSSCDKTELHDITAETKGGEKELPSTDPAPPTIIVDTTTVIISDTISFYSN